MKNGIQVTIEMSISFGETIRRERNDVILVFAFPRTFLQIRTQIDSVRSCPKEPWRSYRIWSRPKGSARTMERVVNVHWILPVRKSTTKYPGLSMLWPFDFDRWEKESNREATDRQRQMIDRLSKHHLERRIKFDSDLLLLTVPAFSQNRKYF